MLGRRRPFAFSKRSVGGRDVFEVAEVFVIIERYTATECYAMARFHLRAARLSLANAVAAKRRDVRADARYSAAEALVWADAWRARARRERAAVSSAL